MKELHKRIEKVSEIILEVGKEKLGKGYKGK